MSQPASKVVWSARGRRGTGSRVSSGLRQALGPPRCVQRWELGDSAAVHACAGAPAAELRVRPAALALALLCSVARGPAAAVHSGLGGRGGLDVHGSLSPVTSGPQVLVCNLPVACVSWRMYWL